MDNMGLFLLALVFQELNLLTPMEKYEPYHKVTIVF